MLTYAQNEIAKISELQKENCCGCPPTIMTLLIMRRTLSTWFKWLAAAAAGGTTQVTLTWLHLSAINRKRVNLRSVRQPRWATKLDAVEMDPV